jgi:hypothetical protein
MSSHVMLVRSGIVAVILHLATDKFVLSQHPKSPDALDPPAAVVLSCDSAAVPEIAAFHDYQPNTRIAIYEVLSK